MALGDGIRRNIAAVTPQERDRFRDAIIALSKTKVFPGTRDNFPAGGVSYWFKQDEIHQATHVHGGPAFLPWHRELCNRFEAMLREVDPDLSLHYWDWNTDPTPLFTNTFMGSATGDASAPWLNAGLYQPKPVPPDNYRDDSVHSLNQGPPPSYPLHANPADPPKTLTRNAQAGAPPVGTSNFEGAYWAKDDEFRDAATYQDFDRLMQGGAHGLAHDWIGGNLGDPHMSFRDPFVFLLHSNVDRLWAMWQTKPGFAWRLDPNQVYGTDGSNSPITDPLEPWAGEPNWQMTRGWPTRPWFTPENQQVGKTSNHPSVVAPPLYDTSPIGAGDHFYSISADGATNSVGYQPEGVACSVFSSPTTLALYRLFSPNNGDHFYTTSLAERDNAIAAFGYRSEDITCYAYGSPQVPGTTPLYRLFDAGIGHHFYTTSATERDNAVGSLGYQSEGIACYVYDSQAQGTTPLYRLFNPANGDHFYTTSAVERDNAVGSLGYQPEGIACYIFGSAVTLSLYRLLNSTIGHHFYTTSLAERDNAVASFGYQFQDIACYVLGSAVMLALYRLFSPNNGDHFYTTSLAERDNAIAAFGYQSEDITCYAYGSPQVPGTTPLYRLLNPTIGHHFYTTSATERDNAVGNLGYQSEGIACYVYDSQAQGITPLYRLFNPANGDHFYTTSAVERDNAVASFGYQSEGIACYIFGSPVTVPLYRLFNAPDGDHFYTTSLAERDNAVASFGYQSEDIACYVYGSQAPGTTPLYRMLKVKAQAASA